MAVPRNTESEFTYTLLPENIHELTLNSAAPTALNRCFAQLDMIFANAPESTPIFLLSDIRQSGSPPLLTLIQYTQRLLNKHPQHEFVYDAVLHNMSGAVQNAFMSVLKRLAVLFGARVAFFRADERDKAIAWLLEKPMPPL